MVSYGAKNPKAFDRGGTCLEFLPSLSMKLHCWSKEKLSFVFFFKSTAVFVVLELTVQFNF